MRTLRNSRTAQLPKPAAAVRGLFVATLLFPKIVGGAAGSTTERLPTKKVGLFALDKTKLLLVR
jgi:hypothetical protein